MTTFIVTWWSRQNSLTLAWEYPPLLVSGRYPTLKPLYSKGFRRSVPNGYLESHRRLEKLQAVFEQNGQTVAVAALPGAKSQGSGKLTLRTTAVGP